MSKKQRRATIEELAIYEKGEVLPEEIKISFADGQKGGFTPLCAHCRKTFPAGSLKGVITEVLPHVAAISTAGWCESCEVLSIFKLRFRAGGVLEWCRNGVWTRQEPTLTVKEWVRRLMASVNAHVSSFIAFVLIFLPLVIAVLKMPR